MSGICWMKSWFFSEYSGSKLRSRNATKGNSQGRQQRANLQPLSPRWGYEFYEYRLQGLTPLAIDCRPFGPEITHLIP